MLKIIDQYDKNVMDKLLRIEQLFILVLGFYLFFTSTMSWYIYLIGFISVDLFMLGYLINPKIGGIIYNIGHSYILAISLLSIGLLTEINSFYFAGIIFLSHIAMDRMFGFGLKFHDNFKHTHLKGLN